LFAVKCPCLPLVAVMIACTGLLGCGHDSKDLAPIRLTHQPPVNRLTAEQLRSLSMDCEKYPRNDWARGRYEAAYCEEAIAAWSDAPLQMVPMINSSETH
jgi:hypothetical protein